LSWAVNIPKTGSICAPLRGARQAQPRAPAAISFANKPRLRAGSILALAAFSLLSVGTFATPASASVDPLNAGTTTITIGRPLSKTLRQNKVQLLGINPASVHGKQVALAVIGGSLDPISGQGSVEQSGGFRLRSGGREVGLTDLVINTATKSLSARLGGRDIELCSVAGIDVNPSGFGTSIEIEKLKLTPTAARALNMGLGISAIAKAREFRPNQLLGTSTSTTQPRTLSVLAEGQASLKTSPVIDGKFQKASVSFSAVAPASGELRPAAAFSFPIIGGSIAPLADRGTIESGGGVTLVQRELESSEKGEKVQLSITLSAIWVDLETRQATAEVSINSTNQHAIGAPGALGRAAVAEVDLSSATISSDPANHTVSVESANATLTPLTAETLNSVFARAAAKELGTEKLFEGGESLGTFSFTAATE
jgi:hypothetical protein